MTPAQRNDYAANISNAFARSVQAIIETGRLLVEAKDALPHGEFLSMVESDLPFSKQTAQQLMTIARDPRIQKHDSVMLLPPSWITLYELTQLDDDTFRRAVTAGVIRPEITRQEVRKLRGGIIAHDDSNIFGRKTHPQTAAGAAIVALRRVREYADTPHNLVRQAVIACETLSSRLSVLSRQVPQHEGPAIADYVQSLDEIKSAIFAVRTEAIERELNKLCDSIRKKIL